MVLDIRRRVDFGIYFFDIEGEGDNSSVEGVFEKIIEELGKEPKVVFNFEKLSFCNSKFLGNMFFLVEMLEKKKGKICIYGMNPGMVDTFEVVGMFDIIPKFDNLQEVLNYLA